MAQDPAESQDLLDPSHDLDMVPLFTATPVEGEVEAEVIRSILDASGIPSILVKSSALPSFGFELRVPRAWATEATQLIADQRVAGPAAAEQAEAAGEETL